MDISSWAAAAGFGGVALGATTLVFRDVIAKKIFVALPAELTYRLLRLIVVCAFVLGLVGTIGYIWLQTSPQFVQRVQARHTIKDVLSELEKVRSNSRLYAKPSLDNYIEAPTEGRWVQLNADMNTLWSLIEKAKDTIVAYDASLADEISKGSNVEERRKLFEEINRKLYTTHTTVAPVFKPHPFPGFPPIQQPPPPQKQMPRLSAEAAHQFRKQYADALASLDELIRRLREMSQPSCFWSVCV